MSLCWTLHRPVTSSATALRSIVTKPSSRQTLRGFSSLGGVYSTSRRDMQTAASYHPHSLPESYPAPRNSPVPDTSISADFLSPSETKSQQTQTQNGAASPSSNVSLREGEAQTTKPSTSSTTADPTKKSPKPRRPLRPRKAAMKLSATAIEQLSKLLSQPSPKMIRVGVKNKGCSGLAYHLEYVDKPGTFDEVVEQDGVKVLIDSKALFSIIGSEMDWHEDKLSKRFVFRNPNIKESCGCGESFMV